MQSRSRGQEFCAGALKAFIASGMKCAAIESPFNANYMRTVMQDEIKRAGKSGKIACGTRDGKLLLYRVPEKDMAMEEGEALPRENVYRAKVTMERFLKGERDSALVEGEMAEYRTLYRLTSLPRYRGIRVRLVRGRIYLEKRDGR